MKTFKFKLYNHKRCKKLHQSINAASSIWNHCIALHKRYYRLYGQHLSCFKLQKHIAKKRKTSAYWQLVGSQSMQDICQRIEWAYQLFFKYHDRGTKPPGFRKRVKYKSFTLKQAGYKLLGNGRIKIGNQLYRYWNSREIQGNVKTITVKRNPLGEVFIFVVTDYVDEHQQPMTGKSAGFDFGLKTFLTISDGSSIESPLFLKQGINQIRQANRPLSKKQKGSKGRERARKHYARVHEAIKDRRTDWFWKLAHQLTDQYDHLFFETLNLRGMQRLWGRKVSDLAFREFLQILEFVAFKKGKTVGYVDQWYPSSKTCNHCKHVLESLSLDVRRWRCPSCQAVNDRDGNAANNIKEAGSLSLGVGDVRPSQTAIAA